MRFSNKFLTFVMCLGTIIYIYIYTHIHILGLGDIYRTIFAHFVSKAGSLISVYIYIHIYIYTYTYTYI